MDAQKRPAKDMHLAIRNEANTEWEKLEKILLTGVSATLAISISFLDPKKLDEKPYHILAKNYFSLSWSMLFLSLLSLLLSYIFYELAADWVMRKLKVRFGQEVSSTELEDFENKFYQKCIDFFNLLSVISAIAGFSFLAAGGIFSAL